MYSLAQPYGRFLSITASIAAPIMTITIITAAIPSSRLLVDAKPVAGEGYGDAVGDGEPAKKAALAEDP